MASQTVTLLEKTPELQNLLDSVEDARLNTEKLAQQASGDVILEDGTDTGVPSALVLRDEAKNHADEAKNHAQATSSFSDDDGTYTQGAKGWALDAEQNAKNLGALGGIDGTVQTVGDLPSSTSSGDYYYVVDQAAYYKDTGNTTDGWEQANIDLADQTTQNTFQKRQTLNEGVVVGSESSAPLVANERGAAPASVTVKPIGGNSVGSVELFPTGAATRTHFIATNQADYDNWAAVEFEVQDDQAWMKSITKGSPNTPVTRFGIQRFDEFRVGAQMMISPTGVGGFSPTNALDVDARLVVGSNWTRNNVRAPGNSALIEDQMGVAEKSPSAQVHVGGGGDIILQDKTATGDNAAPSVEFQDGNGDRLGVLGAATTANSRMALLSDNAGMEFTMELTDSFLARKKGITLRFETADPGNDTNLPLQFGTNTIGFFVNSDAELQAVPGSGSQMVLTSESYTTGTFTTDRSFDAGSTTVDELADVLATLLNDLNLR